jgi:hypothetical protein
MSQPEVIPGFSCLEYKRRVQQEILEETKGMTREEELRYFRDAAAKGPLSAWWKAVQKRARAATAASPGE